MSHFISHKSSFTPQNYYCGQYNIIRRLEIYLKMTLRQIKDNIPKLCSALLAKKHTPRLLQSNGVDKNFEYIG